MYIYIYFVTSNEFLGRDNKLSCLFSTFNMQKMYDYKIYIKNGYFKF